MPDAFSRNPCKRDELILARTGDWVLYRKAIRGVQNVIQDGRFSDENLPPNIEEDVARELEEFKKFERDPEVGKTGASEIIRLSTPQSGVDSRRFLVEECVLVICASAPAAHRSLCSPVCVVSGRTGNERFQGIW